MPLDLLRVSLVQSNLYWEEPARNRVHFENLLATLAGTTDLIVLPEMFTTGFTMNPEDFAETMDGKSIDWMQHQASKLGSALVGSLVIKENNAFYNRLIWVFPNGNIQHYDKRHLFSMAQEPNHYTAGSELLMIDYLGWKICPQICYDLRFPVFSRNTKENPYGLAIYVANWPEVRNYPWRTLLAARAIENQCFVVGVNRVGLDGNQIDHSGDSRLFDPKGQEILSLPAHTEMVETTGISLAELNRFRTKFPVLNDADNFTLHL
jgi:omega-amidase